MGKINEILITLIENMDQISNDSFVNLNNSFRQTAFKYNILMFYYKCFHIHFPMLLTSVLLSQAYH